MSTREKMVQALDVRWPEDIHPKRRAEMVNGTIDVILDVMREPEIEYIKHGKHRTAVAMFIDDWRGLIDAIKAGK